MAEENDLEQHIVQKKDAKKGAKASGKAHREYKSLKEELLALLSDDDVQEKMRQALTRQVQGGKTKAFEAGRGASGKKQAESIEMLQNAGEIAQDIEAYIAEWRQRNPITNNHREEHKV